MIPLVPLGFLFFVGLLVLLVGWLVESGRLDWLLVLADAPLAPNREVER